jgi:hypothetical protein
MIQRIQSVYLLLAAVAAIAFLFIPFGTVVDNGNVILLKGNMNPIFDVIVGVIITIAMVSIFLYKNRKNQALLVLLNIIISIVFIAFESFGAYTHQKDNFHFSIGFILPVFILIFNFLAYKGIKSDEALVKSMDRLR